MTERCVFSGLTAVERQHEGQRKERESATGLSGRERDARSNTRTTKRIVETGPYIRARVHRALFLSAIFALRIARATFLIGGASSPMPRPPGIDRQ
jgi:hypothetical protein